MLLGENPLMFLFLIISKIVVKQTCAAQTLQRYDFFFKFCLCKSTALFVLRYIIVYFGLRSIQIKEVSVFFWFN